MCKRLIYGNVTEIVFREEIYRANRWLNRRKNAAYGLSSKKNSLIITSPWIFCNMILPNGKQEEKMNRRVLTILVLILLISISAFAIRRQAAFMERFTNHGCGYCPPNGVMTNNLAEYYGPELAVVQVHTSGPTSGDPFYTYNTTDMASRSGHYSISGVPSTAVGGALLNSWSTAPDSIADRLAMTRSEAPISFDVGVSGSNIEIDVNVHSSTSGSYRLFACITQSNNVYSAPNGENLHNNVLRDLLPSTSGQTISLTSVGTQHFSFAYTWDGGTYVTEDMKIVVWVQDMSAATTAYTVVSAFWTWWPQDYKWLYWRGIHTQSLTSDGTVTLAGDKFKNVGNSNDTYVFKMIKDMPGAWSATLDVGGTTHSDSVVASVDSGDSTDVSIEVNTVGDGVALIDLQIKSNGSGETETVRYVVTQNAILLIDDDTGDSYETYYEAALDALGEAYYTHDRSLAAISASEMANYELVIWFTSEDYSSIIDNSDLTAISDYLDGGGKLFFSSQDLGYYCNVTYPDVSPWYESYFKASYISDDSDENTVFGSTGGPFVGHTYELFTGDGAVFSPSYSSEISATAGGLLAMQYETSGNPGAGVVYDGTYRLVYLAFGWEGIGDATNRENYMEMILQYLRYGTVGVEETELPEKAILLSVSPNPFNAAVKFEFESGAKADVELEIFDLTGRRVAKVIDEALDAGVHSITWRPSDAPTGVYLARLTVGEKSTTRKILLTK